MPLAVVIGHIYAIVAAHMRTKVTVDKLKDFIRKLGSAAKKVREFDGLPGGDLLAAGLRDLGDGIVSETSLLVSIAAPRLRRLGASIPELPCAEPFEHQLYSLLETSRGAGAYSSFNSLLRRIISAARALEREHQAAADVSPQGSQVRHA